MQQTVDRAHELHATELLEPVGGRLGEARRGRQGEDVPAQPDLRVLRAIERVRPIDGLDRLVVKRALGREALEEDDGLARGEAIEIGARELGELAGLACGVPAVGEGEGGVGQRRVVLVLDGQRGLGAVDPGLQRQLRLTGRRRTSQSTASSASILDGSLRLNQSRRWSRQSVVVMDLPANRLK